MQDLGYNKNRRLFLRIGETVCGFFVIEVAQYFFHKWSRELHWSNFIL